MARILICEPHADVRALYRHVAVRLGHEPLEEAGAGERIDLVLVEPADPPSLAAALAARRRDDRVPIVCASIRPLNGNVVGLRPVAYLLKPFSLPDLQQAIARALAP